jgi:hypothetical protein
VAETHLQDELCEIILVQFLHDLRVAAHIQLAHLAELLAVSLPRLMYLKELSNEIGSGHAHC